MNNLHQSLQRTKQRYDLGESPLPDLLQIAKRCILMLASAESRGQGNQGNKNYRTFVNGENISRPYLPEILITDSEELDSLWSEMIESFDVESRSIEMEELKLTKVLYTSSISFAICYDLWKPKSRKTPGTYFEVILGSILSNLLPDYQRKKYVLLPGQSENVSTDIVYEKGGEHTSLVIPAKITTRERIVQPFAHQRILDSVFGEGVYKSVLMCISETQRDGDVGVNDICVPGTVRLFQSHLAKMYGIYYIDPPLRYLQDDITSIINVGSLAAFFRSQLHQLL